MPIKSQEFNSLIGRRELLTEFLKTKIIDDCPYCKVKVERAINDILDYLERDAEMGVVTPV